MISRRAVEAYGSLPRRTTTRGETLLRARRPQTVPDLLGDVVVNFASEGMMRNARIALASMHEAMEQNRLTADLLQHVRLYLERLPFQPDTPFVAPR